MFLRSLSNEYEHLVVTLENISGLSAEDTHARVIREEMRRTKNETEPEETALQSYTLSRSFPPRLKCFYCGKPGHKIAECRKKKYQDKMKRRSSFNNSENQPRSYAMLASSNSNSTEWIVDYGASYHISRRIDLFDKLSLQDIEETAIILANGRKVYATRKGSVILLTSSKQQVILNDVSTAKI